MNYLIRLKKEILSAILINHKWKGAAPNFISKIILIIKLNRVRINEDINKRIEAITWNKKYLIAWLEGKGRFEAINKSKNLNTVTSIDNHLIIIEELIIDTIILNRFINKLKIISIGEISFYYLSLQHF